MVFFFGENKMKLIKIATMASCLALGATAFASDQTADYKEKAYACALEVMTSANNSLVAAMQAGLVTVEPMKAVSTADDFETSVDGSSPTPAFRSPSSTHSCAETVLDDIEYAIAATK